jgi:hypothetical protein
VALSARIEYALGIQDNAWVCARLREQPGRGVPVRRSAGESVNGSASENVNVYGAGVLPLPRLSQLPLRHRQQQQGPQRSDLFLEYDDDASRILARPMNGCLVILISCDHRGMAIGSDVALERECESDVVWEREYESGVVLERECESGIACDEVSGYESEISFGVYGAVPHALKSASDFAGEAEFYMAALLHPLPLYLVGRCGYEWEELVEQAGCRLARRHTVFGGVERVYGDAHWTEYEFSTARCQCG